MKVNIKKKSHEPVVQFKQLKHISQNKYLNTYKSLI